MNNTQMQLIIDHMNDIQARLNIIEMKLTELIKSTRILADKAIFTGDAGETLLQIKKDVASLKDEMEA